MFINYDYKLQNTLSAVCVYISYHNIIFVMIDNHQRRNIHYIICFFHITAFILVFIMYDIVKF